MNPDTGHLVTSDRLKELFKGKKANEINYDPIPPELNHAAKVKLAGRDEAMVSLTSGGKLSRFAARRRKARRKMAKKSRRKNRR